MMKKNFINLAIIVFGLLIIIGCKNNQSTTSNIHTDDFNSTKLDSSWKILREEKSLWSLKKYTGYLMIKTKQGDIWGNENFANNVFLRDTAVGAADFELSTKMALNPDKNWQQAGLLVFQDEDNYLVLKPLFDDVQKVQFGREKKAKFISSSIEANLSNEYYIKIVRKNNIYSGYFSDDNKNWKLVGTHDEMNLKDIKIGFLVCNGGSSKVEGTEAKIDWIQLTYDEEEAKLPPMPDIREFSYTTAPAENPLKGFLPYRDSGQDSFYEEVQGKDMSTNYSQFPYSMEWFYMPLKDVMVDYDKYDWTIFENNLNDIASRGNHAVFRFYLDYPAKPSGVPEFLIKDGLKLKEYTQFGGGYCPDYSDPKLFTALKNFITELGKKYDGDPRIGFITTGLIGFWGEWHTFGNEDWMPNKENQNIVIHAFDDAFNITKILIRYPMADSPSLNMGYHDDSFSYETLASGGESAFLGRLEKNKLQDKWKTEPIGGEMRPEIQLSMWNYNPPRGKEYYYECVENSHASWLLNQGVFQKPLTGVKWGWAVEGSRRLGYELFVTKAWLDYKNKAGNPIRFYAEIKNTGIAPFYYDWTVQLAAKDLNNKIIAIWNTPWKVSKIIPGEEPILFDYIIEKPDLPVGKYLMGLRIENPLKNGKKLMFADVEQNEDGWLNIGDFEITQ